MVPGNIQRWPCTKLHFGGFLFVCLIFFLRYADKCVLRYSCLVYVKFKDIVNILLILLGTKWHCTFVRLFKCF